MRPMRRKVYLFVLFIALIGGLCPLTAEGVSEQTDREIKNDLLPFHPSVRSGQLDNGIEYFLLEHPFPKDTIVMRLVVDAGSVLETDRQLGLAHFVEHMAFNGTEQFGEDELVAYLERLGMQFGPDVNASTSFDETIYKLEVPVDDPEALRTGFQVMEQWAHRLTFTPGAIERERGVIVEEWRRGQNASQRVLRQHIPTILSGSRYAERLPIGDMEIVRNAPRSEFVSFYRRWYRPDNMAFVVVGDLPTVEMERLVTSHLSSIERPPSPLERPYFDVPLLDSNQVSIATDQELSRSTVSIYIPNAPAPLETRGDYRTLLVRSLFASIINERIREIGRDPEAPIVSGGIGWNRLLRNTEIAVATAIVKNDAPTETLLRLSQEIERARQFGVGEGELARAKERFLQSIDEARTNYQSREAASLADELVRYWTEGEAVPGIEAEYLLYQTLIPEITAEDVGAIAREFTDSSKRIYLASLRVGPDGNLPNGSPVPSESELLRAVEEGSQASLQPLDEEKLPEDLIEPSQITAGSIQHEREYPEVGVTELQLSNGLRVFLKPTELREDEILFSAYSPGGLALVPDDLVWAAKLAPSIAEESGLGRFDRSTLEKILSGRSVQLETGIGRVQESMSGRSRQDDIEILFQMVHLVFTNPRFDPVQVRNVQNEMIQTIEGANSTPQGIFGRRLEELYANGDDRLRSPRVKEVAAVDGTDVREIYRRRFSDPADFAMFFVGKFDVDTIRRLTERYLAGIPSSAAPDGEYQFRETVTSWDPTRPVGIQSEVVNAGSEPVGQYVNVIHGPYDWSRTTNHRINSVADLLDIRLREQVREEAGGSYSVGAGAWRWRYPEPWVYTQISFGMDPARREELVSLTMDVIEEIRTTLPAQDYVERIKAQQRESYRQSLQENRYWLGTLQFYVQHGRDISTIVDYPELIDSLTPREIMETAQRYLDPNRRIELTLLPEDR